MSGQAAKECPARERRQGDGDDELVGQQFGHIGFDLI
jgi:hypothetical protein